jgi:hypothetical protein
MCAIASTISDDAEKAKTLTQLDGQYTKVGQVDKASQLLSQALEIYGRMQ